MKTYKILRFAVVLALALSSLPVGKAEAATITVDTTSDLLDAAANCASVTIDSLPGLDHHISLREAICAANNNAGNDVINFSIVNPGVQTIQPLSALPPLTGARGVTIDGYSQPESRAADKTLGPAVILIEIDGSLAGDVCGLEILSEDNVIKGLAINRFASDEKAGICINGSDAHNNTVEGNYLGTNPAGNSRLENDHGLVISGGAYQNLVGGDVIAERNLISGNNVHGVLITGSGTDSNVVSGNYIGVDAAGADNLDNISGVKIDAGAKNNTVGGDAVGEGNLISGNLTSVGGGSGVWINASNHNVISGNYIGIDAGGTQVLANGDGVRISSGSQYNLIGGDTSFERNVISGNNSNGVSIKDSGTFSNTISGNYIGLDRFGNQALGNREFGIRLWSGTGSSVIGGDTAGERNVISGNVEVGLGISNGSDNNIVTGNFIGLGADGLTDIGNGANGIDLYGSHNIIGGSLAGEGNVISGNDDNGIYIYNDANIIFGNIIGLNASGSAKVGNSTIGVEVVSTAVDNVIGGVMPGERNVISGNSIGLFIFGGDNNTISGNYIGPGAAGETNVGNIGQGIYTTITSLNNTIGPDNWIAYNGSSGVNISDPGDLGNIITQNSIHSNSLGIEIFAGANGGILAPAIQSVSFTPGGVLITGLACAGCTVEIFENYDYDGEGEHYIGAAIANGSGVFSLTVASVSQPVLTATATDATNGTSNFSNPVPVSALFLPLIRK